MIRNLERQAMQFRALEYLRCPSCRQPFRLEAQRIQPIRSCEAAQARPQCRGLCPFPDVMQHPRDCVACSGYEVEAGRLCCIGCGVRYAVEEGIPRLHDQQPMRDARDLDLTARTGRSFGYLWSRSLIDEERGSLRAYHVDRMQQCLGLPTPQGLGLDAGCGEGVDLANQARRGGVEIIGVELSLGGCRMSKARCRELPNALVIQGDLRRLPFEHQTFDFIYSYGVLHHLPSPVEGLRELVRVLKPGSRLAVYLYEEFTSRAIFWRGLLAVAAVCRRLTVRLPPALLYRLCQIGSPIVYTLLTVPYRVLNAIPGCQSIAAGMPFRHGTGPCSLVGDLYDRFSAPIERRYTHAAALALAQDAGLEQMTIVNDRGWMLVGRKPLAAYRMPDSSDATTCHDASAADIATTPSAADVARSTRAQAQAAGSTSTSLMTVEHVSSIERLGMVPAQAGADVAAPQRLRPPRVLPVSIVVPVHNEDPEVVRRLMAECQAAYGHTELIVVDDGSIPPQPVAALRHAQQRGYGAAAKTGIAAARQPWIVTMDGDGQHHVEDIARLYGFVTRHDLDLVIGDRQHQPERLRRVGTYSLNLLARVVTGLRIQDLNCGLRIFRRELAVRYQHQLCDGFSFTTSIAMVLLAEHHRLGWLPITVSPRTHGGSKVRLLEDGCLTAFHIVRLGSRCRIKRMMRSLAAVPKERWTA